MVYSRALAIDPDNTQAHLGIARLALRRREYQRAADSAGEALRRLYFSPMAHFLQGVAFVGLVNSSRPPPRSEPRSHKTHISRKPISCWHECSSSD